MKAIARGLHPYRPKISVIVANYNYGNFLGETLDSLVAQTYRNFEVLVIDNGSTDDSVAVVRRYADRHPFIRLLQHEGGVNKGLPASVKLGVDEAAGEFVAFCESDDQWTPDHLEKIVRFIDRHDRKPAFVVNDFEPFGDPGRIAEIKRLAKILRPALKRKRNRISPLDFRLRNWIFTFSCCMVRRAVLKSCDILSVPRPSNLDWWLWRQVGLEHDIYAIHEKLTRWRLHGDSFTVRDRNPDSEADGNDMVSLEDRLLVERNPSKAKDLEPLLRPEDDYSVDGAGNLVGPDGCGTGVQPSFSIVVACAGASAARLAKTFASIDAQTYRRFEVVLAGAGKEADSPGTVPDGIADRVSKSGAGDGTTLGTLAAGVEKAEGDWVVFLLPGDRMRPEHLKAFAARIVRESETQAFFARAIGREPARTSGSVHADSGGTAKIFAPLGAFACRKELLSDLARNTGAGREALPCATILAAVAGRGRSEFFRHFVLVYDDGDDGRDPFGGQLQRETDSFLAEHCGYPVVTTVVLTYDHAPYIAKAIKGALAQRGRFVHDILVADNGSTDGTWDTVQGFAREHPGRIRVVRNAENIGISGNFRKAISLARGQYVCILEGDDYWCSASKIGKQVHYLEKNPDCSMVFSRTRTLKAGKPGLLEYQDRLPEKLRGEDLASINEGSVIANFSSSMFRRDRIASLPDTLYEGRISEVSLPFYLERFGPIGYISEALSVYRIHPGGSFSGASRLERLRQKRMCRVQALSVCRPECRKALEEIVGRLDAALQGADEAL